MVARQLFMRGARVVASRRIGQLHYTPGDGHQHWHLHDFARYAFVGPSGVVARSSKTGFCFFNTDPIDLSLPRAPTAPTRFTDPYASEDQCGGREARSTYMGLDTGWGDTYPGTTVGSRSTSPTSPTAGMSSRSRSTPCASSSCATRSGTASRCSSAIVLLGEAGARTVWFPAWQGIDTEYYLQPQCPALLRPGGA